MTDILSDYYIFYTLYSLEYLTKTEKKQRHIDLMEWQKKEYNELPTLAEIIDFMKDKKNLKNDVVFLKKILVKRVIEDISNNNLESLKYSFENIHAIHLICEVTNYFYTEIELADMILSKDYENKNVLNYKYNLLSRYIANSIHELPYMVLYGMDGASLEELEEMKKDLDIFKCLSKKLEKNNYGFACFCFSIYNAYGDYLVNIKLYKNFDDYLIQHKISDEYIALL